MTQTLAQTLIDAGPLIALIDVRDKQNHPGCLAAFQALSTAPLTTWPCVAEASYLLGQINGWPAQAMLLGLLKSGSVIIHNTWARHKGDRAGAYSSTDGAVSNCADGFSRCQPRVAGRTVRRSSNHHARQRLFHLPNQRPGFV